MAAKLGDTTGPLETQHTLNGSNFLTSPWFSWRWLLEYCWVSGLAALVWNGKHVLPLSCAPLDMEDLGCCPECHVGLQPSQPLAGHRPLGLHQRQQKYSSSGSQCLPASHCTTLSHFILLQRRWGCCLLPLYRYPGLDRSITHPRPPLYNCIHNHFSQIQASWKGFAEYLRWADPFSWVQLGMTYLAI